MNKYSCPIGIQTIKTKYLESSDNYAVWFNISDCKNYFYENCLIEEQKRIWNLGLNIKKYKQLGISAFVYLLL